MSPAFGYDALNRVAPALLTDTQTWSAASQVTSTYEYDDLGNRVSHANRSAAAIGYEHDLANRMTLRDDLDQAYDLAGNLTLAYSANGSSTYKYHYDHLNRRSRPIGAAAPSSPAQRHRLNASPHHASKFGRVMPTSTSG